MSKAIVGKPIPEFVLPATGDQQLSVSDFKGQKLVIYFYPKDNTPGCTREGQDFRDHYAKFKRANTAILGVSKDSLISHEKFKEKQGFKFDLLSDGESKLCEIFDVIKEKNMYGKKVMGIERSTFLINEKGILSKEWRKVKVAGHVEEVLAVTKAL